MDSTIVDMLNNIKLMIDNFLVHYNVYSIDEMNIKINDIKDHLNSLHLNFNEDDINNSINEIESLKQGICKIESLIISTQEMDKQLAEMNKNQINMSVMFDFEI